MVLISDYRFEMVMKKFREIISEMSGNIPGSGIKEIIKILIRCLRLPGRWQKRVANVANNLHETPQ